MLKLCCEANGHICSLCSDLMAVRTLRPAEWRCLFTWMQPEGSSSSQWILTLLKRLMAKITVSTSVVLLSSALIWVKKIHQTGIIAETVGVKNNNSEKHSSRWIRLLLGVFLLYVVVILSSVLCYWDFVLMLMVQTHKYEQCFAPPPLPPHEVRNLVVAIEVLIGLCALNICWW